MNKQTCPCKNYTIFVLSAGSKLLI